MNSTSTHFNIQVCLPQYQKTQNVSGRIPNQRVVYSQLERTYRGSIIPDIAAITRCMTDVSKTPNQKENSINALRVLARDDTNKIIMWQIEAIQNGLTAFLSDPTATPQAQENAAGALMTLAFHNDNKTPMWKNKTVGNSLAELLSDTKATPKAKENATGALKTLAFHDENKGPMWETESVQNGLIELISDLNSTSKAKENASGTLMFMARHSTNKPKMAQTPNLITCLRAYSETGTTAGKKHAKSILNQINIPIQTPLQVSKPSKNRLNTPPPISPPVPQPNSFNGNTHQALDPQPSNMQQPNSSTPPPPQPPPPSQGQSSGYYQVGRVLGAAAFGAAYFYGGPLIAAHFLFCSTAKVVGIKAVLGTAAHSGLSSGVIKGAIYTATTKKFDSTELARECLKGGAVGSVMGISHVVTPLIAPIHNSGLVSTAGTSAVANGMKSAYSEGMKRYQKGDGGLEVIKSAAQGALKGGTVGALSGGVAGPMLNEVSNLTQGLSHTEEYLSELAAGALFGGGGGAIGGAITEGSARVVSNIKSGESCFQNFGDAAMTGLKEGFKTGAVLGGAAGGAVCAENDALKAMTHDSLDNQQLDNSGDAFRVSATTTVEKWDVHRDFFSGKVELDVDMHVNGKVIYDDDHHVKSQISVNGDLHAKIKLDEHKPYNSDVKIDGEIKGSGRVDLKAKNLLGGHIRHHEDIQLTVDIEATGTLDKSQVHIGLTEHSKHADIQASADGTLSHLNKYEVHADERVDFHWGIKHHVSKHQDKTGTFS